MKRFIIFVSIFLVATAIFSKEVEEFDAVTCSAIPKPPKKSMPKTIMYSLMIPGWGDIYAGNKGTGKVLIGTEIAIWLGYFGFQYYGNIQKDNYMLYAHQNASANLTRTDEPYYDAIEVYRTSANYNTYIREEARNLYPDNPAMQEKYLLENGYFNDNEWSWSNEAKFMNYRRQRIETRETLQRAVFMTGFAILNRLCAVVTSSRNVHNYNKKLEEMRWGFEFQPDRINVVYRF